MLEILLTAGIIVMLVIAGLVDWYKRTNRKWGESE